MEDSTTSDLHYVKYIKQGDIIEKVWECGICNLRHHLFSHTNERPYQCPHCDNGFNQKSNLIHPHDCQNISSPVKKVDVFRTHGNTKIGSYSESFAENLNSEIDSGIIIDPLHISDVYKDGVANLALLKCGEERSAIVKIIKIDGPKISFVMVPAKHSDLLMNGKLDQNDVHKIMESDLNYDETFHFNIPVVAVLNVILTSKGLVLQSNNIM
ncbi:uncharacterized protein LOC143915879 [Arctopsyche grandis]|uniref:uncharacterized protein LOC143915879 n=1 Tax=Arctopsyche grandis TaxID=121162 RepID=UPI00406D7C60